jgi:4-amino-4-deoxy-L-arabinose transferase-like glycosyltransferase
MNPTVTRWYALMGAVALIAAMLGLHRLDGAEVCGTNEAVEGVFVQQMVEHGALLFPLANGREPMYKPPLFHWSVTAIDRLAAIRKVTAFNLRLASVLYATAGVILTMAFATSLLGCRGGFLAGLVLIGSYQYVSQARFGRVDMTLTFFETLALFSFLWWLLPRIKPAAPGAQAIGRGNSLRYLCALALGLAVLSKGPVGALVPLLSIFIFLAGQRRLGLSTSFFTLGNSSLALALGSSWYVGGLWAGNYGLLNRQIGSENFGRFFGALGAMPVGYYLKPIFLNSAPLSLLVPFAVLAAFIARRTKAESWDADRAEQASAAARLLAIFWVVTVAFFTIAAYKRRAYLLPLWPSSAVLLAWWLETLPARRSGRWFRDTVVTGCVALAVFNFVYIPSREVSNCGGQSFRQAAEQISQVADPREPLFAYGIRSNLAPLLFYLDRNVVPFSGKLDDVPPGYIIIPPEIWRASKDRALQLSPILESCCEGRSLILLHRKEL